MPGDVCEKVALVQSACTIPGMASSHAQGLQAWFDTPAFAVNLVGMLENAESTCSGPHFFVTGTALLKSTDLESGASLQLRAAFNNAFIT